MIKFAVTLALALCSLEASAVYKCIGPQGAVSFQDAPCPTSQQQQAVRVGGVAPPDAVPPQGPGVEQRILSSMTRDRRMRELDYEIASIDSQVAARNDRMNNEMNALRADKGRARNNLAGATWEQSLSTEMQAVAAKYKTMNDADLERVKQLRAELATVKQAAPTR